MRTISLTKGKEAIVDEDDYDMLAAYKWHVTFYGYARHHSREAIWMHRLILNAPANKQVDHINGNRLDNRKENLRLCSNRLNTANQGIKSNNTSGYKGVTWDKRKKKWMAQYTLDYKHYFIGYFDNLIEAAKAYDSKALEVWGEYARVNI